MVTSLCTSDAAVQSELLDYVQPTLQIWNGTARVWVTHGARSVCQIPI